MPLFRTQKASVEHVIADQRLHQSHARPHLPTALEPEPQHTCSMMRRDQVFFAGGTWDGCGRRLAHLLLELCSVGAAVAPGHAFQQGSGGKRDGAACAVTLEAPARGGRLLQNSVTL